MTKVIPRLWGRRLSSGSQRSRASICCPLPSYCSLLHFFTVMLWLCTAQTHRSSLNVPVPPIPRLALTWQEAESTVSKDCRGASFGKAEVLLSRNQKKVSDTASKSLVHSGEWILKTVLSCLHQIGSLGSYANNTFAEYASWSVLWEAWGPAFLPALLRTLAVL